MSVADEEARESRRESHSRFINTSRATQQSIIGKKTSVLSVNAAKSEDGSVAKSESDDEKLNLTPCIPPEEWYSLTIGLEVPKKEKDGFVAVFMHIFNWVSTIF